MMEGRSTHDPPATRAERKLIDRLRACDEAAFAELIDRHHSAMRRLARLFVSSAASAEEVAQETWTAVIEGLAAFAGRSSLKTWIFRILVNRAKTRGVREGRTVPFSALGGDGPDAPAVDPDRFNAKGRWQAPPRSWDADTPEALVLRKEMAGVLERALAHLPERQRIVVTLRDAEGWTSEE